MNAEFDPYQEWLGIAPREQPPDLYLLLGLRRFESDAGMIDLAAAERIAIARRRESGASRTARDLVAELTRARDLLLDSVWRVDYDWLLASAAPLARADPDAEFDDETVASRDARGGVESGSNASNVRTRSTEARLAAGEAKTGELLGPYRLGECIERAKMALLYRAEHRTTKRPFFVQSLSAEGLASPEARLRFQREMDIVPTLVDPRFLGVIQTGYVENRPFVAIEHANGVDLNAWVANRGPLPVVRALDYVAEAAQALKWLQSHQLVHADVRPRTLWIDLRGDLRLKNPPISRLGGGAVSHKSPPDYDDYMPPEHAADPAKVDFRGDMYALGCTLFHLLTGRPPFLAKRVAEKRQQHATAPLPSAHALRKEIPPEADFLLARLTSKRPKERPATWDDVIAHLARLRSRAMESGRFAKNEAAKRSGSLWSRLLTTFGWK